MAKAMIQAVYVGDHFYLESGTMMSPLYLENGDRWDWGKLQCALRDGHEVHIRQASDSEYGRCERELRARKKKQSEEASNEK